MIGFDPETIDVRADEEICLDRLLPWLRDRLDGFDGDVSVRQFGGGKANLTYLLSADDGKEYVLRRPPLGPVAKSAHDVSREHRILFGLWRVFPLAPRSFAVCTDVSVIGAQFHVMERRHGLVIRSEREVELLRDRPLARRIGDMLIDVLADLHMADPTHAGLGDLGRPEGFMVRQVEGWTKRWRDALDPDAPNANALISWIKENQPPTTRTGLVHNDYKLDNLLVSADDPATPNAVLDWDMCTRGDVLSDLGTLLNYCVAADDPDSHRLAMGRSPLMPGFPSRQVMIERYAERTLTDVRGIVWYRVFAAFRTAVILQQIYIRWLRGQTRDSRFREFGTRIRALVGMAQSIRRVDEGPPSFLREAQ